MKTRRLRLVRPRWTLGTMLLIVGWSAVVVWLNVRTRVLPASTDGMVAKHVCRRINGGHNAACDCRDDGALR